MTRFFELEQRRPIWADPERWDGLDPSRALGDQYLILSTQGGVRNPDGSPVALGYHTGHWEVGLLVQAAAEKITENSGVPFAAFVSDPCDGRSQGTKGMFDSLPYRNDAAMVMRRLIRSLPRRKGVIGVATCDKGLPAMMMALAGCGQLANVLVPGGVTLYHQPWERTPERFKPLGRGIAEVEMTLEQASLEGCRACGTPGGWLSISGYSSHKPSGCRSIRHDNSSRSTRQVANLFGPKSLVILLKLL